MANIGDAAQSQGDVMRRLHELEGLVRELVAGRRLENATVGAGGMRVRGTGGITLQKGGDLTVEDGGDIILRGDGVLYMEDTEGEQIVYIGADNSGKQVFQLRREGGELMFFTAGSAQWGRDFWSWTDSHGQGLVADDAETGIGLARPWLPVVMYPLFVSGTNDDTAGEIVAYSTVDAADITSETTLWEGRASVQHPWITVDGTWGPGSGSNTPTYRLYVGGDMVGEWTEPSLITRQQGRFDVRDKVLTDWVPVQLTAQVGASDTGAVACQVFGCYLL